MVCRTPTVQQCRRMPLAAPLLTPMPSFHTPQENSPPNFHPLLPPSAACHDGSNLMDNALNGTLPASWAGAQFFQRLRDLNASCNALSGAIPPEWLSASQTVGLDLSRNALAGTIPWRALAAGKALL